MKTTCNIGRIEIDKGQEFECEFYHGGPSCFGQTAREVF